MSRNKFTEILDYTRFDKKNEQSQRLKTSKFAMISARLDGFTRNSQAWLNWHKVFVNSEYVVLKRAEPYLYCGSKYN